MKVMGKLDKLKMIRFMTSESYRHILMTKARKSLYLIM